MNTAEKLMAMDMGDVLSLLVSILLKDARLGGMLNEHAASLPDPAPKPAEVK